MSAGTENRAIPSTLITDSTVAGRSFLTLADPSAITFPRINADNTVTALDAASFRTAIGAGTGSGTVTAIGVTTSNGVSGVSSGGTTPNLTITLGDITPSKVNGMTITTSTGTFTLANGKTFTVSNTLTLAGTDGSSLNIGAGGTLGTSAYITLGTGVGTALSVNTGSAGAVVLFNGAGGTPTSLGLANASGLTVAGGGTGAATAVGARTNFSIRKFAVWLQGLAIATTGSPIEMGNSAVPTGVTRWIPTEIRIRAASAAGTLASAQVGIYSQTGGAGVTFMTAAALSSLSATNKMQTMTVAAAAAADGQTATTIFVRQTNNSANAGTVDVYIEGIDLT